jgi:hypothetical protein
MIDKKNNCLFVCLMVFSATFNNISAISWRSVFIGGGNRTRRKPPTCLLAEEETGVPGADFGYPV